MKERIRQKWDREAYDQGEATYILDAGNLGPKANFGFKSHATHFIVSFLRFFAQSSRYRSINFW
jgi:hypothetical protein